MSDKQNKILYKETYPQSEDDKFDLLIHAIKLDKYNNNNNKKVLSKKRMIFITQLSKSISNYYKKYFSKSNDNEYILDENKYNIYKVV